MTHADIDNLTDGQVAEAVFTAEDDEIILKEHKRRHLEHAVSRLDGRFTIDQIRKRAKELRKSLGFCRSRGEGDPSPEQIKHRCSLIKNEVTNGEDV